MTRDLRRAVTLPYKLQDLLQILLSYPGAAEEGTLPDDEDTPTCRDQLCRPCPVPRLITCELLCPKRLVAARRRRAAATSVAVPETSMDEDGDFARGKNDIRAPRQCAHVGPELEPGCPQQALHRAFWSCIRLADRAHHRAAHFGFDDVHDERRQASRFTAAVLPLRQVVDFYNARSRPMIALQQSAGTNPARVPRTKPLLNWILQKRKSRALKQAKGTLTLADLFAGCGGLTLGALEAMRAAGYHGEVRLAIDCEADCATTYAANFTTKPGRVVCGSITDLVPGEPGEPLTELEQALKKNVGTLHVVVAGPPCQGHSDLNNHSRRDDPKNKLYLKAVRFIELTQPSIALIENVPAARHDKSHVVQTAAKFLRSIGYHVSFDTISAHRFGLPQRRRRLVLIAARAKTRSRCSRATGKMVVTIRCAS